MLLQGAVVVAQLVERLLLTQEVRGLNPFLMEILLTINCFEKTIVKKRSGMALFKTNQNEQSSHNLEMELFSRRR